MVKTITRTVKSFHATVTRGACLACACVFLLPFSAFALRIDNPKFNVTLAGAESYSGQITVENNSDREVRVRVYAEDFIYIAPFDGQKQFLPLGTGPFSIAPLLTLPPKEFSLSPYGRQTVSFMLRQEVQASSVRCGVVFFETEIGKTVDQSGQGIDLLGRVGALVFVDTASKMKKSEFSKITAAAGELTGTFTNQGNTFLHVQGTYYIIDSAEMVKERGAMSELYLLPRDTTTVTLKPEQSLTPGKYTMVVTFDMEGGDAAVKEISFLVHESGMFEFLAATD